MMMSATGAVHRALYMSNNTTDLWSAAAADDVDSLRLLLGSGIGEGEALDTTTTTTPTTTQATQDTGNHVDEVDDFGRTPLHVAASAGAETAVRFLLARGADPNKVDAENHWTPLHRALYMNRLRTALLLLRAGAILGDELINTWRGGSSSKSSSSSFSSSSSSAKSGGALDKDGLTPLSLLSWRLRGYLQEAVVEGRGGDIFAFGRSDYPLGYALPNTTRDVQKPRRVDALADVEVVEVAAARYHSVVCDAQGRVYSWGHGRGGRLGHGDEFPQMFPKLIEALVGLKVVKVAAAENHTVCVTDQGVVYSFGSDRFGQLGHGNTSAAAGNARLLPRRVEALRRYVIADVSAGLTHTVAITDDGEVMSWGGNKHGQLGYEGNPMDGVPRLVSLLYHRQNGKDPRRAIQISAGCRCTLVVIEGSVHGGGGMGGIRQPNKVYQFGNGSFAPCRVDFRPAEKAQGEKKKRAQLWSNGGGGGGGNSRINVVQVAAAQHHNVALSSTGQCFSWGLGADALGLGGGGEGDSKSSSSAAATAVVGTESGIHHTSLPRLVTGMGQQDRGVYVSASAGHTCLVTETGDLFSWGATDGQQGVLGHGQGCWQPIPKRVVGLKRAVKVAAGPEHTIVLLSASSPPLPHPHADLAEVQRRQQEEEEEREEAPSRPETPFSTGGGSGDGGDYEQMDEDGEGFFEMDAFLQSGLPVEVGGGRAATAFSSYKPTARPALPLPTLKEMCERKIAEQVDMRNAISVLAHAEALGADELAVFCVDYITRNLDGILIAGRPQDLDFLLEDAADDINTLLAAATVSSQQKTAAEMETEEAAAAAGAARGSAGGEKPSPIANMLSRAQRGQDPSLEDAAKVERGAKKRIAQIDELERLQSEGNVVLSVEQLCKVSRRQRLEGELQALQPLLAKLRVLEHAREVREKEAEKQRQVQVQEQEIAEAEKEKKSKQEKGNDEDGLKSEDATKPTPPSSFVCEVCNVTCASESIWDDHLKGRRHSKRLAKVQAEEAAAKMEAARLAKEAREKEMWARGSPMSPWGEGISTPTTTTNRQDDRRVTITPSSISSSTTKKSFREILEEEEARERAAAARGGATTAGGTGPTRPRATSMSSSSPSYSYSSGFGRSPGTGAAVTVGSPQSYGKLKPLSSPFAGAASGGKSVEEREGGAVLLSAYFKDVKTTTPTTPQSSALSATKSTWASNSSASAGGSSNSKAAPLEFATASSSSSRNVNVPVTSPPDTRGPGAAAGGGGGGTPTGVGTSTTVSFSSIMAEEERKAAAHRFSGNNCPWYTSRRDRSDSFEVIQTLQRVEAAAREEEESRALAEALAVAAAEEEKERQQFLRQQQRQNRRRSKSFSSPSSTSAAGGGGAAASSSSSSAKKDKGGKINNKNNNNNNNNNRKKRATSMASGATATSSSSSSAEVVAMSVEGDKKKETTPTPKKRGGGGGGGGSGGSGSGGGGKGGSQAGSAQRKKSPAGGAADGASGEKKKTRSRPTHTSTMPKEKEGEATPPPSV